MGTTGLIFTAIAVAWLAYLVPHFARSRGEHEVVDDADPTTRFSDSLRTLRRGTAPLLDQNLAEIGSYEVSTPMTRRAAIEDLRRLEGMAAARRRRVLVVLLVVLTAVLGAAAAHLVPLWPAVVPAVLLLAFLAVARFSVRTMHRGLDARYDQICAGGREATVFLSRAEVAKADDARNPVASGRVVLPGALWDPVPITVPTYVSKPLAPRTVRTIDLSGPDVAASTRPALPVTADARPALVASEQAVGSDDRDDEMPASATA